MIISAADVAFFRENGFVVIRQILTEAERQTLLAALERIRAKVIAHPERYHTRFVKKSSDTWGCGDVFMPDLYEEPLADYLARTDLLDGIRALLQTSRLRFWGGHALWSPEEHAYDLHWHRDGTPDLYDPSGAATHVQFNTALGPDSAFLAVPGSHRRALTPEEADAVAHRTTIPLPGEVVAHCEPGDVVFMNAWTLHRGRSPARGGRRTLHFNLQPAEEEYGAGSSRPWMRDPDYLQRLPQPVRELMDNLVAWDETHPDQEQGRRLPARLAAARLAQ